MFSNYFKLNLLYIKVIIYIQKKEFCLWCVADINNEIR